jgi:hypothetical protein
MRLGHILATGFTNLILLPLLRWLVVTGMTSAEVGLAAVIDTQHQKREGEWHIERRLTIDEPLSTRSLASLHRHNEFRPSRPSKGADSGVAWIFPGTSFLLHQIHLIFLPHSPLQPSIHRPNTYHGNLWATVIRFFLCWLPAR